MKKLRRIMRELRRFWRVLPIVVAACMLNACDSSDNHADNYVKPITIGLNGELSLKVRKNIDSETNQRLSQFFAKELHHPYYKDEGKVDPGFFGELEWDAQPCYLINSKEEFSAAYKGNEQLPEVDFERYSVLVGRTYRVDGSESLSDENVYLVDENDHYRMALSILRNVNPNYFYTCDIGDLYYWDVYPKRESKPISVERRAVEKVVDLERGAEMLEYQWTLEGYIDENGEYYQVGEGWGDERFTVSFQSDGIVKGRSGNNSYSASYQAQATGAHLSSGDGLAYTGKLSLSTFYSTMINDNDPFAQYFRSHLYDMEYFDVNSYYLRLANSKGMMLYFRESSLK